MAIVFREDKDFSPEELQSLFLSVGWDSGNYPVKLSIAMANSDHVLSAWDGDKLVGLVNALSDGAMTVYFHYLLVRPEYQRQGIGQDLLELITAYYEEFARKVLISYEESKGFYEKCGFFTAQGSVPMFRTNLNS